MNRKILMLTLILFTLLALPGQGQNYVEANYDKTEYQLEMRDGIKLYTIVYTPKDQSEKYPILMQRTPYSIAPYGERMRGRLSTNDKLEKDKYIFVFQDVRGKFMSEGEFLDMRPVLTSYKNPEDVDETTDTWDTVEWLIKNIDNNNGKVGMYGVSYPGFYTVMGSINAHPAMVCTSPQAPISDWFLWDDMHHNGALTLPLSFNFFQSFGKEHPNPQPAGDPVFNTLLVMPIIFSWNLGPLKMPMRTTCTEASISGTSSLNTLTMMNSGNPEVHCPISEISHLLF